MAPIEPFLCIISLRSIPMTFSQKLCGAITMTSATVGFGLVITSIITNSDDNEHDITAILTAAGLGLMLAPSATYCWLYGEDNDTEESRSTTTADDPSNTLLSPTNSPV